MGCFSLHVPVIISASQGTCMQFSLILALMYLILA